MTDRVDKRATATGVQAWPDLLVGQGGRLCGGGLWVVINRSMRLVDG